VTDAATISIPYAGGMDLTADETEQKLYYDDGLYASISDFKGYDAEIKVAEMDFQTLEDLGLGTYDSTANTFQENMTLPGTEYSLRFIADTVDRIPRYVNFRSFKIKSIRNDSYQTLGDNIAVSEVIIKGTIGPMQPPSLSYKAIMGLLDDKSNQAACDTFLTGAETYPTT